MTYDEKMRNNIESAIIELYKMDVIREKHTLGEIRLALRSILLKQETTTNELMYMVDYEQDLKRMLEKYFVFDNDKGVHCQATRVIEVRKVDV